MSADAVCRTQMRAPPSRNEPPIGSMNPSRARRSAGVRLRHFAMLRAAVEDSDRRSCAPSTRRRSRSREGSPRPRGVRATDPPTCPPARESRSARRRGRGGRAASRGHRLVKADAHAPPFGRDREGDAATSGRDQAAADVGNRLTGPHRRRRQTRRRGAGRRRTP